MNNIIIDEKATITLALKKLKISGNKCLVVLDKNKILLGTLTDGDLRKKIILSGNTKGNIKKIYNRNPHVINEKKLHTQKKKIISLFVKKKLSLIPIIKDKKKFVRVLSYENFIKKEKKFKKSKITCPIVIMAGGKGTRLKPFTNILPKPLMPIKDKTVIEKIILGFKDQGFKNFIITINYKAEILKAYFKELKLNVNIKIFQEKNPLGTVGGIAHLKNLSDEFILTNCDNIYNFDYINIIKSHKEHQNDLTLAVAKKKVKVPYGVCNFHEGNFNNISEKPTHNFIVNAGMYVVNKSLLKFIKKNTKLDMDKFLHQLIKRKKKIGVFEIKDSQWHDTGQWNELRRTIEKYS